MEDEQSVEDEQREKRMIDKRNRRRLQEEKRKRSIIMAMSLDILYEIGEFQDTDEV